MKTEKILPFCFKVLIVLLVLSPKQSFGQQQNQETTLKILPVLWQQTSAEYRALCYQAFNLASLRLKEIPAQQIKKKTWQSSLIWMKPYLIIVVLKHI